MYIYAEIVHAIWSGLATYAALALVGAWQPLIVGAMLVKR